MSEIEELLSRYERYVRLPWDYRLAGAQKVWFARYDPGQERRLRLRIGEFETATTDAGHTWHQVDITDWFAEWMANHEYKDAYFEHPEDLELALVDFSDYVAERVRQELNHPGVDENLAKNTVVALLGLASLFGFIRVAELVAKVDSEILGRLLAFFPGQRDGSNWRLLNARDGWNYHAVPIEGGN